MAKDFFGHLRSDFQRDLGELGELQSEEQFVKYTVAALKVPKAKERLLEIVRLLEHKYISFEAFNTLLEDFPYVLGFAKLFKAQERCTVSKAFCHFGRTPIPKAFEEKFGHLMDQHWCGLIFAWQGVAGGLVAHNGPIPQQPASARTRSKHKAPGQLCWIYFAPKTILVVERLEHFLGRLDWAQT